MSSRETPAVGSRMQLLISALVLVHMLAVIAEPLRFFTRSSRGTSPLVERPRQLLAPYIEMAYLSHGYFFFAPEPGPSHLMEFTLTMPDGSVATVRYPDRRAQWPRLLYHRYFMLSENLNQLWVPPWQDALPPPAAPVLENWKRDRQRYEMVRDSYIRHVAWRFGAANVVLDRIEHILPSSAQVFDQRMQLHDKRLYVVLPDAIDAEPVPRWPATTGRGDRRTGGGVGGVEAPIPMPDRHGGELIEPIEVNVPNTDPPPSSPGAQRNKGGQKE